MTTQKSIPARLHTIKRTALKQTGQDAFETEIPLSALAQQARSNPASLTSDHVLRLQRAIGNKAITGLTQIQRADTPAPAAPAPAATPAPAAEPVPESYPDIDALDLNETAKAAAIALKKKYPDIIFTSGKRDFSEQAHAMASNVVSSNDRKWVEKTYASNTTSAAIQKWIDDNATATTVDAITAGIIATLDPMTDAQKAMISKHPIGAAFDVQPREKDAEAIKKDMAELKGATKFLEKEGGLVRWHVQF